VRYFGANDLIFVAVEFSKKAKVWLDTKYKVQTHCTDSIFTWEAEAELIAKWGEMVSWAN